MQYSQAFAKLGYTLVAPRQDWSAEREDGVCITLWRSEIDWKTLTMDSRVHGGPLEQWSNLPGNAKRIRHARRALAEFVVDVIVVDGVPGQGVIDATPWNAKDRKDIVWRVTELDEATGHIRMEAAR